MSKRMFLLTAVAGLMLRPASYGQTLPGTSSNLLVAVHGVTCAAAGPAGFPASAFQVAMSMTSIAGSGSTKAVFGDLTLTRVFDSCTPRLAQLGATQQHVTRVTITSVDKSNQPVLTVLLEDVTVSGLRLDDAETTASTAERVSLSYTKMTLTDVGSNTSVVITR